MKKKENKNENVVFRNVGGRIVPIAVGGAIAADAARTKTIYQNKKTGVTIDKKKFAKATYGTGLADELVIKKNGKKAGFANFSKIEGNTFGFNMLKIDPKFRGQGLSKTLTAEASREMKRQGAKKLSNQVIHPGSLKTNFDFKRDKLVKLSPSGLYENPIGKKQAIKEINLAIKRGSAAKSLKLGKAKFKIPKNPIDVLYDIPGRNVDIFRETSLKQIKKTTKYNVKPFRSNKNKLAIASGVALMAAGAFWPKKDKK